MHPPTGQISVNPNNTLDHYTLWTYIIAMHTFIELHPFATVRDKYLNDDEFAVFQLYLTDNPEVEDVIPRSGGCRKLRWAIEGR